MRKETAMTLLIIFCLILAGELLFICWQARLSLEASLNVPPYTEPTVPPTDGSEPPTNPPTLPPTDPPTDPPTEAPTDPPVVLHSGLREDGSFGQGTMFIGDSLTYGLVKVYLTKSGHLGDAMYMAMPGKPVTVFFSGTKLKMKDKEQHLYNPEFEGLSMDEVVAQQGGKITAVYFMMGTNHVKEACADSYIEIVDYILDSCPDATVYLQLVPYSRSSTIKYELANENIRAAYDHYVQAENPRVMLIDTHTAIGKNLTTDGIHLTEKGQEAWYNAIVAFAQENNIPE